MKKFLIVAFLAFLASSFVFAETVIAPDTDVEGVKAPFPRLEVMLGVTPSEMFFYTFGFSNESGDSKLPVMGEKNIPEPAASRLGLSIDPMIARAVNDDPIYLWYKAWTDQNFRLKIETVGNLVDSNGNLPDLGWSVKLSKVDNDAFSDDVLVNDSIYSNGNTSIEIRVVPNVNEEVFSSYKMDISTDVLPLAAEKANFEGTIRMSVECD